MEITSLKQLDIVNGVYTYADYLLWKFKERVELLRGKIFEMSAPSPIHQEVLSNLNIEMGLFFRKRPCKLYPAPFDVRIPTINEKGDEIHTVVQPDISVICDTNKIDSKGCLGAPDLVVEIISPGNSKKEMENKFNLYQEAGVCEYWIVHPIEENILIYVLEKNKYVGLQPITKGKYIQSVKFPDLKINTSEIFKL